MTKFLLGMFLTIFFVAAFQGIPEASGQTCPGDLTCPDDPDCCTTDADCTDPQYPICIAGVCESRPTMCQSLADCADPCKPACDLVTYMCVEEIVVEETCNDLEGAAYGLCNAYCEAMDCDGEPEASDKACERVLNNYMKKTGSEMPLCGSM